MPPKHGLIRTKKWLRGHRKQTNKQNEYARRKENGNRLYIGRAVDDYGYRCNSATAARGWTRQARRRKSRKNPPPTSTKEPKIFWCRAAMLGQTYQGARSGDRTRQKATRSACRRPLTGSPEPKTSMGISDTVRSAQQCGGINGGSRNRTINSPAETKPAVKRRAACILYFSRLCPALYKMVMWNKPDS